MKYIIAATLGLFLAACAPPAYSQEYVAAQQQFPTSKHAPKGKPWTVMHDDGYQEKDTKNTCKLLDLTNGQCMEFMRKRDSNMCRVADIPNGVVLDGLTFTKNGKHQVQKRVLVALQKVETRKTLICDLGDGTVVFWFFGCNNYAVVMDQSTLVPVPRMAQPRPVQPPLIGVCNPILSQAVTHVDGITVGAAAFGWKGGTGAVASTPGSSSVLSHWYGCPSAFNR